MRTGIGSRKFQRRIALKPGKIWKAVEKITQNLQPAAISGIGSIRLSMTVVSAIALVAYGRGGVPFDPVEMPFFNDVSQLLLDPRHHFWITHA